MAKWSQTAEQSGKYLFDTSDKYVDRDIELVVPKASGNIVGSANTEIQVAVGEKQADGKYPVSGEAVISGKASFSVTQKGFTDNDSYTGSIGGTATASGKLDAATLSADVDGISGTSISSVTVGNKSGTTYPITGNTIVEGTLHANVTANGYATNLENTTKELSQTVNVNANIPAAAASVVSSGTIATPSIAKGTGTVSTGTITTSKPSSGPYVCVTASSAATTVTNTVTVNTAGYLGNKAEITTSGSLTKSGTRTSYLPITAATVTPGTTTVTGTTTKTATRGTFDIAEGYISGTAGDLGAAKFNNAATSGVNYVDISETSEAPVLISGDYLYINKGYTDNLKISLAKLIPDGKEDYDMGASGDLLEGKILYNGEGQEVTGTIQTKGQSDLSASGATVTVPAGYYPTQVTKSVATGSVHSYAINEDSQKSVIATAGTKDGNYYPISIPSLTGTVNRTAGYISGTTSTAADSNGGVVGKIAASTVSGSNNNATASASASSTNNLASGTYTTTVTTGYTYHIDTSASASVANVSASKTVSAGYNSSATTATATVTGASKSSSDKVYLLDGVITNNTSGGTSAGTITSGKQIKIAKGYYPTDKYYTAQSFTSQAITGSLSASTITSGYTAPTLLDSAPSTPYLTIVGNGSMTSGNRYNGTANAKTQYMKVYAGTYSITPVSNT